jgi:hypothetical protein
MAQVPFEPSPHAADPSNADEPEEQPSPPSTASPEPPSPPPSPPPKPERSEVDVKRERAEKDFEQALTRLGAEARRLNLNADQFEEVCVGGRGEPGSCLRLLSEISASAAALGQGVQEAEDDARHAWVTPGVLRDFRYKHGLDEGRLRDQATRVQRLAARFQGSP